jgi:hypothetical protein
MDRRRALRRRAAKQRDEPYTAYRIGDDQKDCVLWDRLIRATTNPVQ